MEGGLLELFTMQARCIDLKVYKNEFETMRILFHLMADERREFIQDLSLLFMQGLEENENMEYGLKDNGEKDQESHVLRQEGNRLFTAKGDKRNVLGACRLYNDAIYAALDTNSNSLALGFANRAMALQTFGYFQQAYDDCVCALKLGYPETLRHKIIMRQAYCSIKMNKVEEAEKHLSELKKLNLSAGFLKELDELLVAFDDLKKVIVVDNSPIGTPMPLNRDTQEIITTKAGRCMQAKCDIEKNQLIFTERASAFVAVGDTRRICHHCGTPNFIPIPCLHCRGRVNYCSLKCQKKHNSIHTHECPAYRFQLFAHVGIAHLALRIMLDDGLFSILNDLKLENTSSTFEVWLKMNEGGDIWKSNSIQYAESLRMITHLNKMPQKDIEWFALASYLLVAYLKNYTKYFEVLNAANENIDWKVLTGSLILRHIGQLISNGHTLTSIIPLPLSLKTTTDFHMLNENVWSSPWHLKLGCLHSFSNYDDLASLNLPYLSLCNHSCIQMFQPKFDGRFISTYALRNIKKGEEITNCYDLDYRKGKREKRRQKLQQTYNFECRCENCRQTKSEDVEFNKYYQYRCDNTQCGKLFVSSTPEIHTFDLLQSDLSNRKVDTNLYCTICSHKQTLKWYHEAKNLMPSFTEARSRRRLYEIFKDSEKYLVGLNKARCFLAQKLVQEWFDMFWGMNFSVDEQDFCNVIAVIKYILNVTRERSSVNSTEYIIYMIYLWDLMALHKYKCPKAEMDEMLWAISVISDDLQMIFLNYYNDFIKEYLGF